jgi:hypothetical protein
MKFKKYAMPSRVHAVCTGLLAGLCVQCAAGNDALMQRVGRDPVFPIDPQHAWRSIHVANAAVLPPDESPDRRWRLYIRGSGRFPGEGDDRERNYHDSIGLFTQEAENFSPHGPWEEYPGNPILVHGPEDGYDGKHLLDCSPVWGRSEDGESDMLYMFYKGVSYDGGGCLAGAVSTDGGLSFSKFDTNPLQRRIGPCDVVYHKGRYHIFYGDTKYDAAKGRPTDRLKTYLAVTSDPAGFAAAPRYLALDIGSAGSFDSVSVHGGRIFRLNTRWYMVYQCSARHMDYPERFHVAWSDDLIRWEKVENPAPFFERGDSGTWDEGAIWYGEVFEHEGMLYMYYEGWGGGAQGVDRDKPYFRGGRSQTGLACVSVSAFLAWCGHGDLQTRRTP